MQEAKARPSLQRRIVLQVILGMTVVLAVFGISSYLAVRQSIDRALQERLVSARATAEHLEYVLSENLNRLESIAFAPGVDLEDNSLEPEKKALHEAYVYSIFDDGLVLLNSSGQVLWAEPSPFEATWQVLKSLPFVRQALNTGRPSFSDVFTLEPLGKPMISAVAPLRNRSGDIVGAVVGNMDLPSANLLKTIQPITLGETGYTDVVDGAGVVITSTRLERILQESDHGNKLANLIEQKQTTKGTCHTCHTGHQPTQRENEVLAFAPLPTTNWGISIRQSEQEALAPVRDMQNRFLFFGLVMLGLSLSLAWSTARSVVRPIEVLIRAARRISSGNLSEPIPSQGKDEVGLLSHSLDEMREKLRSSYDELDRLNRELEQRVQRRTKELAALVETSQTLALVTPDLNVLLQTVMETALKALDSADAGALFLHDRETNRLAPRAAIGYDMASISRLKLAPGEGIVGRVFQSDQPVIFAGAGEISGASLGDPEYSRWLLKPSAGTKPQSAICVPLKSRERVTGSLILVSLRQADAFSQSHLRLLLAIAAHAALAVENATLYGELQRKEAIRGELLRKLISAQEDERKRIARDLHDDTSQSLAALIVAMDRTSMMVTTDGAQLKGELAGMKNLATRALEGVHQMIFYLRPSLLDDLGLLSAIRWYAESRLETMGVKVRFESTGAEKRLPGQVETAVFRAVQEAINNIAKHAEADNVLIDIQFLDEAVVIEVEDDGKGFDVEAVSRKHGEGFGLTGMRERIALLNGDLDIQSQIGGGTRLRLRVPLTSDGGSGG